MLRIFALKAERGFDISEKNNEQLTTLQERGQVRERVLFDSDILSTSAFHNERKDRVSKISREEGRRTRFSASCKPSPGLRREA